METLGIFMLFSLASF